MKLKFFVAAKDAGRMVNAARFRTTLGDEFTLDRQTTEWDCEKTDGTVVMIWRGVYLWEHDGKYPYDSEEDSMKRAPDGVLVGVLKGAALLDLEPDEDDSPDNGPITVQSCTAETDGTPDNKPECFDVKIDFKAAKAEELHTKGMKRTWIISACSSETSGPAFYSFYGTARQAAKKLLKLIREDRANEEREAWECGSVQPEELEMYPTDDPVRIDGYANYADYHIDYAAVLLDAITAEGVYKTAADERARQRQKLKNRAENVLKDYEMLDRPPLN